MIFARDLLLMTGGIFWTVIGLAVLGYFVFATIPAIWRAICYAGFSAFADAEEKRTAKRIGQQHAETRARIAALGRQREEAGE